MATQSAPLPRPALRAPRSYFNTSVGTKVLVGATGLLLFFYLILHLAGNLLLFLGPETFNGYSHLLISNPLVIPVEIGLRGDLPAPRLQGGDQLPGQPPGAPGGVPQVHLDAGGRAARALASTTMILSGMVVFVFVLMHLYQFKYGPEYLVAQAEPAGGAGDPGPVPAGGGGLLQRPERRLLPLLHGGGGGHLWHGIASAFKSLGASHPRYTPWVFGIGKVLAFVLAMGFR